MQNTTYIESIINRALVTKTASVNSLTKTAAPGFGARMGNFFRGMTGGSAKIPNANLFTRLSKDHAYGKAFTSGALPGAGIGALGGGVYGFANPETHYDQNMFGGRYRPATLTDRLRGGLTGAVAGAALGGAAGGTLGVGGQRSLFRSNIDKMTQAGMQPNFVPYSSPAGAGASAAQSRVRPTTSRAEALRSAKARKKYRGYESRGGGEQKVYRSQQPQQATVDPTAPRATFGGLDVTNMAPEDLANLQSHYNDLFQGSSPNIQVPNMAPMPGQQPTYGQVPTGNLLWDIVGNNIDRISPRFESLGQKMKQHGSVGNWIEDYINRLAGYSQ